MKYMEDSLTVTVGAPATISERYTWEPATDAFRISKRMIQDSICKRPRKRHRQTNRNQYDEYAARIHASGMTQSQYETAMYQEIKDQDRGRQEKRQRIKKERDDYQSFRDARCQSVSYDEMYDTYKKLFNNNNVPDRFLLLE